MSIERTTIGALFDRVALSSHDREALVFAEHGLRRTYSEIHARVNQLAKGLMGLGIEPGEHLAVWAITSPEWLLLQLATAKIGAVLVALDPAYRSDEFACVLAHSDATTLFVIERAGASPFTEILCACCPEIAGARPGRLASKRFPRLKRVALIGEASLPGMLTWTEVLAAGAGFTDHLLRERQEMVDPDDPASLQYTSDTTDTPRAAELTHGSLATTAWYAGECMRLTRRDRVCVPVPFHRGFGYVLGTLTTIAHGACIVVPAERFDAEKALAAVAAERCTALHGVPAMFVAELAQRRFHEFDLSSLRTGIVTGAPCSVELMEQIVRRMRAREITIAYGQTEASSAITQTRVDDPLESRLSTVGRPLPGIEVKIVDPKTGSELPRGLAGELWCRGYGVMRGYYKMPDATASVVDPEGWLRTGDLATMDDRDFCRVTGRIGR